MTLQENLEHSEELARIHEELEYARKAEKMKRVLTHGQRLDVDTAKWEEINPYHHPDEHRKMKEEYWKALEENPEFRDAANPPVEMGVLGLEETINERL